MSRARIQNGSFPQPGITRREFLAKTSMFAMMAPVAASVFATPAYAAPKTGGHVRVGLNAGSASDTLDPATVVDMFPYCLNMTIRNCLTEILPDGSLAGELAESWDISSDAKIWTFKLRKGITFHSGKPLAAEDVVASIDHHRGEKSKSVVKVLTDQLATIRADGGDRVRMELKAGNADWAYLMSDFHLTIEPVIDGKLDWESGDGTGPYALTKFEPGVRTTFRRNPNYWKADRAYFDSGEFIVINDDTARINALRAGSVDVISRVDPKIADLLAKAPRMKLVETPGIQMLDFLMLTDTAPFTDNNVRLAMKYAVDREAILAKILNGHGVLGNDQPIASTVPYYAGDIPQREYDPDRSKAYLKKAGLSNLQVSLSASDGILPGSVDAATLYSASAVKAGIDLKVERVPADGFWDSVYIKKPFVTTPWGGRATADWMFSMEFASDAPWNDMRWRSAQFDKLLVAARSELDETRRAELYRECQLLVHNEAGAVTPVFMNNISATSDKIGHLEKLATNWELDGARFMERWWFV